MNERKPVLVVVDVQNGFITEHSQPVVPVIVDLVRRWQAHTARCLQPIPQLHRKPLRAADRLDQNGFQPGNRLRYRTGALRRPTHTGRRQVHLHTVHTLSGPTSSTSTVGLTSTCVASTPTAAYSKPPSTPSNATSPHGSSKTPAPATPDPKPTTPDYSSPQDSSAPTK